MNVKMDVKQSVSKKEKLFHAKIMLSQSQYLRQKTYLMIFGKTLMHMILILCLLALNLRICYKYDMLYKAPTGLKVQWLNHLLTRVLWISMLFLSHHHKFQFENAALMSNKRNW